MLARAPVASIIVAQAMQERQGRHRYYGQQSDSRSNDDQAGVPKDVGHLFRE
jgi:hypothetical protein